MRPRLITAENLQDRVEAMAARVASMRPRLITAENLDGAPDDLGADPASMRPRLITAENVGIAETVAAGVRLQ